MPSALRERELRMWATIHAQSARGVSCDEKPASGGGMSDAYGAARRRLAPWIAGVNALSLLHSAYRSGILAALRTARTREEVAAVSGTDPDRAADVLAALNAHGVVACSGGSYHLTEDWMLLSADDAHQHFEDLVEFIAAFSRSIEHAVEDDGGFRTLSPMDHLAFARGATINPAPPVNQERLRQETREQLPEAHAIFDNGGTIIELGCGVGGILLGQLKAYPRLRAVGVDVSFELIMHLRNRARQLGVSDRLDARVCDARSVREENAFEVVNWSQTFFPAETRCCALHAAYRALKPGGYLIAPLHSLSVTPDALRSDAGRAWSLQRVLRGGWGVPERDCSGPQKLGTNSSVVTKTPQLRRCPANSPDIVSRILLGELPSIGV